ncbi:FecCD family ABC transporter permease [Nocardia callitridis]|uniref:Iron ABC transporter permease n=1 Tax=Nocardia callitridis TaxID=648753 RepID=A0ABP9K699_9NOCA
MTVRKRRLVGVAALVGFVALTVVASLVIGAQSTSPAQVWHALFAADASPGDELVWKLRMPRTLLGVMVGVALGVAGALLQGHTRNPLADTGLLGLNAGAAFAVVLSIHLLHITDPGGYIWFALLGSLIAAFIVFGVSALGRGGGDPLSLAIAGAAVTFFLQAMTNALALDDITAFDSFRFWIVGALGGRDLHVAAQVAPFLVVGLLLAAINTPALNVLALGEDTARALGGRVRVTRAVGLAAVALLSGAATAACGPIAFLGLVVPHVARWITGPDHRWLVPYSGLLGAAVLLAADVVGRVVVPPGELSVGIALAVFGAPCFVMLVRRRRLAVL